MLIRNKKSFNVTNYKHVFSTHMIPRLNDYRQGEWQRKAMNKNIRHNMQKWTQNEPFLQNVTSEKTNGIHLKVQLTNR